MLFTARKLPFEDLSRDPDTKTAIPLTSSSSKAPLGGKFVTSGRNLFELDE
jgi:hypothetical protein